MPPFPHVKAKLKKNFLKELSASNGIVYVACQATGISRGTYYNWHKQDPAFQKAADDINEETLDKVESKFLTNINAGDTTAMIFYLKTKGKHRGYIERQEITGKDGESLYSKMSDEELESKVNQLVKTVEIATDK